jgi:hypothetical protein
VRARGRTQGSAMDEIKIEASDQVGNDRRVVRTLMLPRC